MAGTRSIRNRLVFGIAALAVAFSMLGPVGASAVDDDGALDMYTADVSGEEAAEIASGGFDIADSRHTESGVSLDFVLTDDEAKALRERGVDVKVKRNKDGKSVRELAAEQAASGFNVWRSWTSRAASATSCTASRRTIRSWSSSKCSATPTRVARSSR